MALYGVDPHYGHVSDVITTDNVEVVDVLSERQQYSVFLQ